MKPAFEYCMVNLGLGHMNDPVLIILIVIGVFILLAILGCALEKKKNNEIEKEKKYLKMQKAITDEAIRLAVEEESKKNYKIRKGIIREFREKIAMKERERHESCHKRNEKYKKLQKAYEKRGEELAEVRTALLEQEKYYSDKIERLEDSHGEVTKHLNEAMKILGEGGWE